MDLTTFDWFDPDLETCLGNHDGLDYQHGVTHGRDEAHREIGQHVGVYRAHAPTCDCRLCRTHIGITMSLAMQAARDAYMEQLLPSEQSEEWTRLSFRVGLHCATNDDVITMLATGQAGIGIAQAADLAREVAAIHAVSGPPCDLSALVP